MSALKLSIAQEIIGSKKWLTLITELANRNSEAAYSLARWYEGNSEQKLTPDKRKTADNKAKMWFEHAIRLSSSTNKAKVQLTLAKLYFKQNDFLFAQALMTEIVQNIEGGLTSKNIDLLTLQIEVAIALGQTEFVIDTLITGQDILSKTDEGRLLISDIERFNVIGSILDSNKFDRRKVVKKNQTTCSSSLQLFATNLKTFETSCSTSAKVCRSTTCAFYLFSKTALRI